MKNKILIACSLICSLNTHSQQKHQDSLAILLVDRMSDIIGDLESCQFKLSTVNDLTDSAGYLYKQFTAYEVFLSGNNKLLIHSSGDKGHRQLSYNGAQLAYYFQNENHYGILDAPGTTIAMMDSINTHYDINFPAADFFFPSFTDDLLSQSQRLDYLGKSQLNGKDCFHLIADSKEITFQLWISNDGYHLPAGFVVTYKTRPGNPQYQGYFSEWQINPDLPVSLFDFQTPPGASLVRIMSKSER